MNDHVPKRNFRKTGGSIHLCFAHNIAFILDSVVSYAVFEADKIIAVSYIIFLLCNLLFRRFPNSSDSGKIV